MANVLSERIAELRRARGLTQEQLGQLAGVSAQAVSKWEKGGAPDVELLPALADTPASWPSCSWEIGRAHV